MCNICTRFAQDCTSFSNTQYMRTIVLLSPMGNICATFAQDCTYFLMRNICARFAQHCTYSQCAIYAQDLRKIVLLFLMCNICTRLQALLEEIYHISHICAERPVKLIRRVKIAHSFLQCVSNQFHVIILSLPYVVLQMAVKEFFETDF